MINMNATINNIINHDETDKIKDYNLKISNKMSEREHVYSQIRHMYDIRYKAQDEFIKSKNNTYYVIKCDSDDKIDMMIKYMSFYYLDNIHSPKKLCIGIDLEFNQRQIALCQLSFYPSRKFKYIFIFEPLMLSKKQTQIMIKTVFTSNINKIMHGSDSLDMPYICEELLNNDRNMIYKFISSLFDTRFLCEYYKIYVNEDNKKCSIYDALLYFNVISIDKYNDLNKVSDEMVPIQNINWSVNNMDIYHLKYASYDVLYLKKFLKKMIKYAKKQNIYEHMIFIQQITRYVYYEKYKLIDISNETKTQIDPMNNYIVDMPKTKETLISIYNVMIGEIELPLINFKIKDLLNINYFKSTLSLLFKRIIFAIICEKYTIYINKKDKYDGVITFRDMYKILINHECNYLVMFLERFYQKCKLYISNI